jgi:hypothetical protein
VGQIVAQSFKILTVLVGLLFGRKTELIPQGFFGNQEPHLIREP